MKAKYIILLFAFSSITACGQQQKTDKKSEKTTVKSTQKNNKMDLNKITNPTVKSAIEAWQNGDSKSFLSYFTSDAKLYDDGSPRNFQNFVKEACGHEKFTTIEKVGNDGKDIIGNFHTESWGDFKTYFNFTINEEGKFSRLDIGQAK